MVGRHFRIREDRAMVRPPPRDRHDSSACSGSILRTSRIYPARSTCVCPILGGTGEQVSEAACRSSSFLPFPLNE